MSGPARVGRLTADLAGLGGRIRTSPEDFRVEELPLYEAAGDGDHVHFEMEKKGISTFEALLWISKAVKVSEHSIGYAGLKDAKAVTRQRMSVHRVPPGRILAIEHPRIRVLSAVRHPTRIRIGHLRGNRFTIRIRDAHLDRLRLGRQILGRLAERGVPNAYGVQRFGVKQDGHFMGRALLTGDFPLFLSYLLGRPDVREGDARVRRAREAFDAGKLEEAKQLFPMKHRIQKKALTALLETGDPVEAFRALGRRPRRIYTSAYQSWLFNRCLDRRIADGTYDRLLAGDLAWQHATGALYRVEDPEAEAPRATRFEASPSGPLPGYEMRRPCGPALELETHALEGEDLRDELFRSPEIRTRGSRRPYRAPLVDASLEEEGPDTVVARFTLPPGSFATVVLDELMKNDPGTSDLDTEEADEAAEDLVAADAPDVDSSRVDLPAVDPGDVPDRS